MRRLYNSVDIDDLLGESDSMAQRRKESAEMLTVSNCLPKIFQILFYRLWGERTH